MRITLLTALLLGTLSGTAVAEDFGGFYAGVNAGYARGCGERDRQGPGAITGRTESSLTDPGLPPSARSASEIMRMRGRSQTIAR